MSRQSIARFSHVHRHSLHEPWYAFISGGTIVGAWLSSVANNLWDQGITSPEVGQGAQSPTAAPQSMTLLPQAPDPAATNATNGTPGSLVVSLAAPVNSGSHPYVVVEEGGTPYVWIGNTIFGHGAIAFDGSGLFSGSFSGNCIVGLGPELIVNAGTSGIAVSIDGIGGSLLTIGNSGNGLFVSQTLGKIMLGTSDSGGGAGNVIGLGNASTAPSTAPSGGGVFYASSGHLYAMASSGVAQLLAT